jgi:tRNA1Val (adenine37-N6)-methyltransferase
MQLNQLPEEFSEALNGKGLKNDPHVKLFYLKGLPLLHHIKHMGIGTDAILLGSWANMDYTKNLLDIGTGCGILSIIAQLKNTSLKITAIEPNQLAFDLASINFNRLAIKVKIHLIKSNLEEYAAVNDVKFQHIISNPPFFSHQASQKDGYRFDARSSTGLTIAALAKLIPALLSEQGCFSLIYPIQEGELLMQEFYAAGFFLSRLGIVFSHRSELPVRYLMEWKQGSGFTNVNRIYLDETLTDSRFHPMLAKWLTP